MPQRIEFRTHSASAKVRRVAWSITITDRVHIVFRSNIGDTKYAIVVGVSSCPRQTWMVGLARGGWSDQCPRSLALLSIFQGENVPGRNANRPHKLIPKSPNRRHCHNLTRKIS